MYRIQTHSAEPFVGTELILQKFKQQPACTMLLHGHSSVFTASLLVGSMLSKPIAVIDGATRFNSYTLSSIAKLLNVSPRILLQKTYVTRSFTAFQTEAAITTKLTRFLARTHCPLVVILGLLDTYYDEQVKPHECEHSLRRIFQTFRTLTMNNVHILISDVDVTKAPLGKEKLFPYMYKAVDVVMSLQPDEHGLQFKEERRTLTWDGITTPLHSLSTATEKHGSNFAER
jgi:hypothetical protein